MYLTASALCRKLRKLYGNISANELNRKGLEGGLWRRNILDVKYPGRSKSS